MKISNEFTVHTPIEQAWKLLTDLEAIAPCMPGAQLTGVEGDTYKGKVKIKVGPVISEFAGTARFVEKSDTDYRAAIDAKGRDPRSAGNAAAVVTAVLRPDGDHTTVSVDTDLKITGKLAQFGSGMIKEVSSKLLAQFVTNLEARLAADATPASVPEAASAPGSATAPGSASASASAAGEPVAAAPAAVVTAPETAVSPAPVAPALINGAALDDSAGGEAAPGGNLAAGAGMATSGRAAASPLPSATRELTTAEAEPLDLLSVAGRSMYKRLVPVAIGVVVVAGVLTWLAVRRR